MDRRTHTRREAAVLLGLLVGAVLSGSLAAALWESMRSADELGSTASVSLQAGDTTAFTTRLDGLVPGSYRDHTVTVGNDSSVVATLTYAVRGAGGQSVTTDANDGLRVRVWTCSQAYVAGACGGIEVEVTTSTGVDVPDGADATAWTEAGVPSGQRRHLRIRVLLPSTAPSTMQAQTFTVTHLFSASLAAGGAT